MLVLSHCYLGGWLFLPTKNRFALHMEKLASSKVLLSLFLFRFCLCNLVSRNSPVFGGFWSLPMLELHIILRIDTHWRWKEVYEREILCALYWEMRTRSLCIYNLHVHISFQCKFRIYKIVFHWFILSTMINEASYSATCNGQVSSLLDSDHYQTLILLFSLFSQKSIDD